MSLHLDSKFLAIVTGILKAYGLENETYVFGSRVRGDHKKYSDLDLVLKHKAPLPTQILIKLKDDFEKSHLPISVDFVEWFHISDDFRKRIEQELVPLKAKSAPAK